jgi:hypothetical protein
MPATLSVAVLAYIASGLLIGPEVAPAHPARAGRELTAYGATHRAWAAHHVADPNPRLVKGCCYLPKQSDGRDRYVALQYNTRNRVFSFVMHFGPRVTALTAKRIVRRELPPDARLVGHARKPTCEQFEYRSRMANRAVGTPTLGIEFLAHRAGGVYRGRVGDAVVASYVSATFGC